MALRGNLRDFSLPDVFQLVTFSRKTGVLRIEREDGASGSVWFRDGDAFFASSNWRSEPLGERLVRAHRITPQALKRGLELRAIEPANGRRLGQILTDEGYITEAVLENFVSEQIQDTIFDLMRWDEGEFDFEPMPEVVEEDIGLTVSIENVVMEGSRRLEEWGRIRKKIPSTDVVFKMATAPGEGTFEISLKPAEWQLLLLIDATRSVAELARATGRTDFEVARVIYGLFSAGLLEFATEEEIEHNRAERLEREARLAQIESERREIREAEEQLALERESRLAAEAAARLAASEVTAAEPAVAPGPSVGEPEFLGVTTAAPVAGDDAVLEEYMGAVLESPTPLPQVGIAPEPAPRQHVPAEEPAFIAAEHPEESEASFVPVPSVGDLMLGLTTEPEPNAAIDAIAASFESEPASQPGLAPDGAEAIAEAGPDSIGSGTVEVQTVPLGDLEVAGADELEADLVPLGDLGVSGAVELEVESIDTLTPIDASVSEPEPLEAADEAPVSAPEPDFVRDLMALGLGEMPEDLLAPPGPSAVPQVPPADLPSPVEPMSELGFDSGEGLLAPPESLPPHERVWDRMAEAPEVTAPETEQPLASASSDSQAEPDFSALLESLDVDAEPDAPTPVDTGFDAELLRDEPSDAAGGVISTDAFLEGIEVDNLALSGAMTDELSALTGADRRPSTRPQASVNAIPDSGAAVRRDARVDRDTIMKIIEGVRDL